MLRFRLALRRPPNRQTPDISPYAYCNWNPLKYIDPDGNIVIDFGLGVGTGVGYGIGGSSSKHIGIAIDNHGIIVNIKTSTIKPCNNSLVSNGQQFILGADLSADATFSVDSRKSFFDQNNDLGLKMVTPYFGLGSFPITILL